ncbi:single-stranded-DNA-specific exonuclease RecJ [Alkaliphilus sp. B6464]|uniref:single-stranded-DNA-specific exonuclease RecJ n=1 Tax=Alkaliphilus sp. B6464 TaxID=2731219 RepID=UPI001BA7FA3F|nr:single-stranded-DNA-specific exonuclease RecJ [Alkaliphilus sp. B6464]QUH21903.1 single-stranded-DNA-specific exonuclease RecJ [Alkaliphilus sp. B6464]
MKWITKTNDKNIINHLSKSCKITEFQANLLMNRGIVDIDKANKYLYGDLSYLYDQRMILDIDKGGEIIAQAIKDKKKITVFGDYDTDGITAIAASIRALNYLGANVDFYLPHRIKEGYGMNCDAIRVLKDKGTELIITVDNGIASIEEVKLAKELGMQIVVTDHHDCPPALPEADAVINMKRANDPYPNKNLCGCALIWRVMEVVFKKLDENIDFIYDLLPIVAIGTIQDMMDLTDENRILVKEGLLAANYGLIEGINALMKVYELKELRASDVAYKIGPTLNADGRLYTAETAVELMITDNKERALDLAKELHQVNEERKLLTAMHLEETETIIKQNNLDDNFVMVVLNKNIPEGLVGLIASKIKEKYQVPTFIFTEGEEYFKCSGRGVEEHPLDLFSAIQKTKHLWVKGGGHKMACGLSMKKDKQILQKFSDELNQIAKKLLNNEPFVPYIEIDGVIDNPTEDLVRELEILEPIGKGNVSPRIATNLLDIEEARPVGDGSHLRFKFNYKVDDNVKDIYGIAFGMTYLYQKYNSPNQIKVLYSPSINVYTSPKNNQTYRNVQMQVQDFKPLEKRDKSFLISSLKGSVKKAN